MVGQDSPADHLYDPYRGAAELGLRVHKAPLISAQSVWMPDANAIVIAHELDDIGARCAVAHQVMHAGFETLADSCGPDGLHSAAPMDRSDVERAVCTMTARRLLPLMPLRDALAETDSAEQVAELMHVSLAVLARRVQEMTPGEHQVVHGLTSRLYWPERIESSTCGRVFAAELAPRRPCVTLADFAQVRFLHGQAINN